MIDIKIEDLLDKFRSLPSETEWLEFKEAKNNFDFDDIGKYFSALSNEANLKEKQYGWLIFGVEDKKKKILGIPAAWEGHYYGRDGESLGALNLQEIEQIRNQVNYYDWSAQICKGASSKDKGTRTRPEWVLT